MVIARCTEGESYCARHFPNPCPPTFKPMKGSAMTSISREERVALNTDRELWRETEGDYYANSIHVTEQGAIGINVGGHVVVYPLEAWHRLVLSPYVSQSEGMVEALEAALPGDECVNCGKHLSQHPTGSGYGMCQIYPIFRSRRAAFSALVAEARALSNTPEKGESDG